MSLKDKIKKADDFGRETVLVKEWDVSIEVRSLSARHRSMIQTMIADEGQTIGGRSEQMWSFLLLNSCYEPETGDPVFDQADMDWVLTDKAFSAIDFLTSACLRISGLVQSAVDDSGKSSSGSQTATE